MLSARTSQTNHKRLRGALLIALFFIAFQNVSAKTSGNDVILVLDTSGSMATHDAQQLRKQAARMFVALMSPEDRVAVMRFSGKAQVVTGLNKLSSNAHKNRVIHAIDRVSSRGAWTNIHTALQKSYDLLKQNQQTGRNQIIVLMSDGKMDVGDKNRDQSLTEKIFGPLTESLAKDRIKVHSIAFTDASNLPFLQLASKDTKGFFTVLKGASGIHEVFETLFERSVNPDMLPIAEDSFVVDETIREMTIVVSKYKANSKIALEAPDGKEFTPSTVHPSLNWVNATQYDLITVTHPTSGFWRIKFSEGGNRAYVYTDLKLVMESALEVLPGNDFEFYAWLEKNNKRVTSNALLNATRFVLHITHPDGKKTKHILKKNVVGTSKDKQGILNATLAFSQPGTYKLEITSSSEVFDRKKSHFVTVKTPITKDPFKVLDSESVTEKPEISKPTQTNESDVASEPEEIPAESEKQVQHSVPVEPEPAVEAQIEGPVPTVEAQEQKQDPDAEASGGKMTLLVFLIVNSILGIAVLGFFLWRRFKSKIPSFKRNRPSITDDISASGIDLGEHTAPVPDTATSFEMDGDLDDAALGDDMMDQDFDDIDLDEIDEEGALEEDVETSLDQTNFDQSREAS